jgi:uncharacterized membrane protein YphA (DoxX/SURF4 family)
MGKNRFFDIVRILLGVVFFFAALYRIFNYSKGAEELSRLGIPVFLVSVVIIVELTIAASLILNKYVKYSTLTAIVFLVLAIIIGITSNFSYILQNIGELFVFDANPTDILLHVAYIFFLFLLFKNSKK